MVITPKTIINQAIEKYGSLSAVARRTQLYRSTLKRIRNGETIAPHPETIALLVKALNAE